MEIKDLFRKETLKYPIEIYDSQGNKIYHEKSNGYWAKREFDSQGNEIYFENLRGFWYKNEYDSQGNKIYFEDSDGLWVKRECDSQGTEIYYENSRGEIRDNRSVKEYTIEQIEKIIGEKNIKIVKG